MTNLAQNYYTGNTTYLEFPIELFNQLGTNEKLTREVNYSHGVSDKFSNHLFYCTMYAGKRYKTTLEQKEQAEKLYQINKQKVIDNIGNKLVFVGMGMEYTPRYKNDVCNHRIRTEIVNTEGKRFFIEVGTWGNELMRIDHVINRDQQDEYDEKVIFYRNEIEAKGGFNKVGRHEPLMENYLNYQKQPYHWYKHNDWKNLKIKYTNENVLNLVNTLFNCNFKEMTVDYNHLTTDDYVSTSPKFN